VEGCQSWKLALETSENFVATRAGNLRWNPARVSGKCVMSIRMFLLSYYATPPVYMCVIWCSSHIYSYFMDVLAYLFNDATGTFKFISLLRAILLPYFMTFPHTMSMWLL